MNINKRLLHYVQTMRIYIVMVGAMSALTAACIVLQACFIAQVITGAFLARETLAQLSGALLALLAVLIIRALVLGAGELVTNLVSCHVKSDLRGRLLARLFTLGPLYTRGERSGEIVQTTADGVEALDAYFVQFFPQLCATMIIPLAVLVVVFSVDRLSGIVLLTTLPILPFFMILIGKQANAMTEKRWRQLSLLSAHFLDVLQGLTTLKLFGRARAQQDTIRRVSDRYAEITMNVLKIAFLSSLVMEMGATISTAIVAVEIGLRLLYGAIPFQQAFFVLLLAPEFYLPLRSLGSQFHASMESAASAERIFDILETPMPEQAIRRVHINRIERVHTLQLHDVGYTYSTPEGEGHEALKGVSFQLGRGQKVALVGTSGAGKSTIASLLLRFIEPTTGEITVDGSPIQQMNAQDWRRLVAWQPQRPYIFNTTVAENIRLGRSAATMDEVMQAARAADIHDFIQSLPQGYETIVGERGTRLSGGQIQRLSLARALLRDVPILVLDEATSTLDAESEEHVMQTIDQLARDRIVLVIAHRMRTITTADHIIVLHDGQVVAQGTHQELLEGSHLYREMMHAYEGEEVAA